MDKGADQLNNLHPSRRLGWLLNAAGPPKSNTADAKRRAEPNQSCARQRCTKRAPQPPPPYARRIGSPAGPGRLRPRPDPEAPSPGLHRAADQALPGAAATPSSGPTRLRKRSLSARCTSFRLEDLTGSLLREARLGAKLAGPGEGQGLLGLAPLGRAREPCTEGSSASPALLLLPQPAMDHLSAHSPRGYSNR